MKSFDEMINMTPSEARLAIREGQWNGPTAGICPGRAQANLIILPKDWAFDFLLFAQRNPKPCPILDVTEPGNPEPAGIAPGADIRIDLPKYRIWKDGILQEEPSDITLWWRDDLVGFLTGCSFTFEKALMGSGIPIRHIELQRNVPMYITNKPCKTAGRLAGPLVVTMRPILAEQLSNAVTKTALYPAVHGSPVHIGDPAAIGIKDLSKPDFGDSVPIYEGEVPVFWACGVTPQAALMASKPPFAITHAPGHMFIADTRDEEYSVF
jgi:uncharacterized protein YcsI (UPF0317 family)